MKVVTVYTRIYGKSLTDALGAIGKSPWTLLLPMALGAGLQLLGGLVISRLPPLLSGIVFALATDAVLSSYLYFVDELVGRQRVKVHEFRRSFGVYFWSILNLMFVLWIARFVLSMVLRGVPDAGVIYLGLMLVAAVALNASPEVIYLRRTYGGLQTIQASWEFLKENWGPWFLPTLPLLALVVATASFSAALFGGATGVILSSVLAGALLHVVMVFRGFLFRELDGSSHRQRMFRFRNET